MLALQTGKTPNIDYTAPIDMSNLIKGKTREILLGYIVVCEGRRASEASGMKKLEIPTTRVKRMEKVEQELFEPIIPTQSNYFVLNSIDPERIKDTKAYPIYKHARKLVAPKAICQSMRRQYKTSRSMIYDIAAKFDEVRE